MKCLKLINITILTILFSLFPSMLSGQGWSDEIQMTHFGEDGLMKFYFKKDSNDNLHFIYSIGDWGEDDRCQTIYQKFNRLGEPLTDPIIVSEVTNVPDTTEFGNLAVDLFLNDNVIHILCCTFHYDTNYRFYYSSLDLDGNPVSDAQELHGFEHLPFDWINTPYNLVVDSRNQIIIGGSAIGFFDNDTFRTNRVFYQKYSIEGERIDDMHSFERRNTYRSVMKIIHDDNIAFVWNRNVNAVTYVYYSMIAPDDSVIIDTFSIQADEGWGDVNYVDYEMDSDNFLTILLRNAKGYIYLRKYDSAMNRIFQVPLGHEFNWKGDIFIDLNNSIHVGKGFEPDEGRRYVGYSLISNEGKLLDSS